jgi:DNA invertase Pin-like site-specific DNA recombinase
MVHTVRALVGARVSHVQGEEKTSHISQRGKGQSYAESQGWTVVGAFEDLDVSAIKLSPWKRPDLKAWLTDKSEEWDALIFAKTDRVFRSAADCVKLAEWCKEHHKILVLVDDGIRLDYFNPEDAKDAFAGAMSKVFLILASVFAEIEGQRFVQRARDRVAFLRNTDRWGHGIPPFGFQIVAHPSGKGKALAHDDEAQKVLSGIATRFLAGDSLTAIAVGLNDAGVLTARDRRRVAPQGESWTAESLKRILSNPTTQGIKTSKGKVVLDADGEPVRVGPASFDTETWNRLQSELEQRSQDPRKRRHSINPLLGVAKCGVCGKNLRQRAFTSPSGRVHRYYVCGRSPKACPGVSVRADAAEDLVYKSFLETHTERKVKAQEWRDGSDHSAELDQTNRTIERLREDRLIGLYDSQEDEQTFRQQMRTLIAKRDELAALPIVRAGWVEVATDETYGDVWPDATPEERRKMLTDAHIRLMVHSPTHTHLFEEYDKLLGEGPTAEELWRQLESRTVPPEDPAFAARVQRSRRRIAKGR